MIFWAIFIPIPATWESKVADAEFISTPTRFTKSPVTSSNFLATPPAFVFLNLEEISLPESEGAKQSAPVIPEISLKPVSVIVSIEVQPCEESFK